MKYVLLTIFSVLVISSSVYSQDQLIVTRAGEVEGRYDVTNYQPGELYFYLDQDYYTRYLWQGEDSIDYYIENGLLWVNGRVVGIDLEEASLDDIPNREDIVTAIAEGQDMIYLYQLPYLKAVQVPHINGNGDFSLLNEMTNLVALDLADGAQSDSSLAYLKPLKDLKLLYLGWGVTDTGLTYIEGMTNLKLLYLAHTSITDEGLRFISGLRNLEVLVLGGIRPETGTRITDSGLRYLAQLTNLRELHLGCAELKGMGLGYLSCLDSLVYLNLFATHIHDGELPYLLQLESLESVNLCGTDITDAGIATLAKLPHLSRLNVGFTAITDHGLMELAKIPSLEKLIVWGYTTPLTEEGLEEFRKLRPDCELLKMDFWPD